MGAGQQGGAGDKRHSEQLDVVGVVQLVFCAIHTTYHSLLSGWELNCDVLCLALWTAAMLHNPCQHGGAAPHALAGH